MDNLPNDIQNEIYEYLLPDRNSVARQKRRVLLDINACRCKCGDKKIIAYISVIKSSHRQYRYTDMSFCTNRC